MDVCDEARTLLREPWGNIITDARALSKSARIIAIGDACTVHLLKAKITPYLAIFDLKTERAPVDDEVQKTLNEKYPHPRVYENYPGTLSDKILLDAPKIMETGGSIKIIGEEDITALAFMQFLDKKTILVYGQPGKGMVVVEGNNTTKKRLELFMKLCKKG